MKREDRTLFLAIAGLALLLACSSGEGHGPSSGGGGAGGTPAGPSNGSGGPAGGASAAGAATGGLSPGGGASSVAGAPSAGSASGGVAAGGVSTGGAGSSAGGGSAGLGGVTAGSGGATGGSAGASGSGGTAGSLGAGGSGSVGVPIGFAALNGGTTGGKAGQVVSATTYAELKQYAESTTPYVIRISGTISNGANGGSIKIKSNKSLIGVGNSAFLNGVGLDISGTNSNVIVQNLRISLTGVTTRTETSGVFSGGVIQVNGGDAISISGSSKNVWIDHCEVFSEDPAVQTDKDLYDGLIDIKGQTGFITLSYNYLHDHHKGGLVGASDADLFADRKVTLHHNYYKNVKLRVPMYRGAVGHFFNNYVVGATDATEIRVGTCLRVERNYYEKLHYSIYTPSDAPGSAERIENVEVERASRAYPASCTADVPYDYAGVLIKSANDVKSLVPQLAGVGKL